MAEEDRDRLFWGTGHYTPSQENDGEAQDRGERIQAFLDKNFGGSMQRYREWVSNKLGEDTREGVYGGENE